ncbi:MAG TPA: phosphoenolpyruvate synthase [Dehalococcoidia bacterium]|nr:phosphoenolpyruvate synthase [Dehalococcoidia bacterium]
MNAQKTIILWFNEIGKDDIPLVGGKGANLGEITRVGVPVPPGFVITADTYFDFIEHAQLTDPIRRMLESLNVDDNEKLQAASARIKKLVLGAEMSEDVSSAIVAAYEKLGSPLVAVMSSATAEDLPEASFAGQQSTYLNITGAKDLLLAVKNCWASLFEPRAIFYRVHQHYDHFSVRIAVPVQKMIQSQTSGVMFTVEPVSSDDTKIVVEAIWGLGEAIVSGAVTPDLYLLDKATLAILERKIAAQEWKLVRNPESKDALEANARVFIRKDDRARQKVNDAEIRAIAEVGKRIEQHYGTPQDIEWARDEDGLYILQTRPVTTMVATEGAGAGTGGEMTGKLLISGSPASPGVRSGPVKAIFDVNQIDEVKDGDILVTVSTNPDFVPAMKRAVAIVTDKGGRTSHASIVSRELGIPCIVGTENGTKVLKSGQIVTVDGTLGKVWEGALTFNPVKPAKKAPSTRIKTATRLYVNLAEPELAGLVAQRDVDGVGLLRAEFIIAHIGVHPRYALSQGRGEEFVERLATDIEKFAAAFNPRPVVYRTSDFKTNEYRNLEGGQLYEGEEENPMLGYRGASRYINEPEVFKMEADAIKRVRRRYKNLWVMIPFVRTVKELVETKKLLSAFGLRRSKNFQLWMMVEIPANVFLLDEFLDVGIDGISIGSNDLTQLVLGVDRDNPKLAEVFDERNPAVLRALEHVVTTCRRRKVTCSICGQGPSVYPELTRKLVEWGTTSVSVTPDMIDETRLIIADCEQKIAREAANGQERRPVPLLVRA